MNCNYKGFVVLLFLCLAMSLVAGQQPAATPAAIVEKAINACGGKERLARLKRCHIKSKGFVYRREGKAPYVAEAWEDLPESRKVVVTFDRHPFEVIVLENNKKAWTVVNGKVAAASSTQVDESRRNMYVAEVLLLYPLVEDNKYKLSTVGERQISGKQCAGVRVSTIAGGDVDLFFALDTHLLVKYVDHEPCQEPGIVGKIIEEEYSEYRLFNGLNIPTKNVVYIGGAKKRELEIVDIQPLTKIDAAVFSPP